MSYITIRNREGLCQRTLTIRYQRVCTTTSRPINRRQANISIINVVILSLSSTVRTVKYSDPLNMMSYSFRTTERSTCKSTAFCITRATSRSCNVYNCSASTQDIVNTSRAIRLVTSLIRLRNTRVCPYTTARALISNRLYDLSLIVSSMFNVKCALKRYLMTCVGNVFALFLRIELVTCRTILLSLNDLHLSRNARLRQVFSVLVKDLRINRSRKITILPFLTVRRFLMNSKLPIVIVRRGLLLLPIAFAKDRSSNTYVFRR